MGIRNTMRLDSNQLKHMNELHLPSLGHDLWIVQRSGSARRITVGKARSDEKKPWDFKRDQKRYDELNKTPYVLLSLC